MHTATIFSAIAALAAPLVTGWLVVAITNGRRARLFVWEHLALAWIVGWALLSTEIFLAGLARAPLAPETVLVPALAQCVALFLIARRMNVLRPADADIPSVPVSSRFARIASAALLGLIIAKLLSVVWLTIIRPVQAWDSFVNWSATAKMFYYSGDMWLDDPGHFFGRGMLMRNANYPPQNPLMQVWMALWIGRFDECLVKLWAPGYLAAAAACLYSGLKHASVPRAASLGVVTVMLASPILALHATESYSDLPLAACVLASVALMWRMVRGERAMAPLLGFCLAACALLKDEGVFFVMPMAASSMALAAGRSVSRAEAAYRIVGICAPMLLAAPWFIFKFTNGLAWGADHVVPGMAWHPENLLKFARSALSFRSFNIVVPLFAMVSLAALLRGNRLLYLCIPLVAYAMFFVGLYTTTAFFSQELMYGTAFYRNALTWYPAALFVSAVALAEFFGHKKGPPSR